MAVLDQQADNDLKSFFNIEGVNFNYQTIMYLGSNAHEFSPSINMVFFFEAEEYPLLYPKIEEKINALQGLGSVYVAGSATEKFTHYIGQSVKVHYTVKVSSLDSFSTNIKAYMRNLIDSQFYKELETKLQED